MAWYNNALCCVVALAFLMFSGTVVPYLVGSSRNDTQWFIPFISDGGVRGPERYIFTEILNVAAFAGMLLMLIKFKVTESFEVTDGANAINRLNKVCLIIGIFSTFSLTFVANFPEGQETYHIGTVHDVGAGLVFGLGILYAILDSAITVLMNLYRLTGRTSMKWYEWLRPVFAFCSLVVFVLFFIGGIMTTRALKEHSGNLTSFVPYWWQPTESGYDWHVLTALCEWLMALFFVLYFLTFSCDFKQFNVDVRLQPIHRLQHIEAEFQYEPEADTAASAAEQSPADAAALLQNA